MFVACFWISLKYSTFVDVFTVLGALVAGIGGALVWTAQGSYFGQAAQDYAVVASIKSENATSFLAGVFAFIYLTEEVACKLMSWALLQSRHSQWTTVFGVYTIVAATSTLCMATVHNYPTLPSESHRSIGYKMTAAWQLLRYDPKMKYLIGLNAVFGFAYPFVNSYVNGEVVHRVVPRDWNLHDVGLFSAISSAVAALCSLTFGSISPFVGKGPILVGGSISFASVAFLFIVRPNLDHWGWNMLSAVYCFQGVGRATVEGPLRATFADFFPKEVEGAFANIILQNGIFTSFGFFLSFSITCSHRGPYCVEYKEGGLHNVLVLELAVVISAFVAILGYWKVSLLFRSEQSNRISENDEEARYMMLSDESVIDEATSGRMDESR
jgi:MFS family permease